MTGHDPDKVRGWVALILASTVGAGVLLLTGAALIDVWLDPEQSDISPQYITLIQTTLGVLVGGLVGYLGGTQLAGRKDDDDGDPRPGP